MRTFEHFPTDHKNCPICGKNTDGECLLVPIDGTEEDNIMQAIPVHSKCLQDDMRYLPNKGLIVAFARAPTELITQ